MEIINNNNQQQQQMMPMDPYFDPYGYPPPLPPPMMGSKPISHDQNFMKWLLGFRKEVTEPLRYVWAGYLFDTEKQKWIKNGTVKPIMNENGINWAISYIESYTNPVFLTANYDDKHFNFDMREACKVIYNTLCMRWREFGLVKTDIMRVGGEVETKVKAILLGARDDGYRQFFTKQYTIQEHIMNQGQQQNQSRGVIQSVFGMFKGNR